MTDDSHYKYVDKFCCTPEKNDGSQEIKLVFYRNEFENLLYGLAYQLDYVNAVSELQEFNDNFFFDAKVMSEYLIQLLTNNLASKEDLTLSLDMVSLRNLLNITNSVLYMSMPQKNNPVSIQQSEKISISGCFETFLGLNERIRVSLA